MNIREWFYVVSVLTALVVVVILFNFSNQHLSVSAKTEIRMRLIGQRLIEANFQQKVFLEAQPEANSTGSRGLASAVPTTEAVKRALGGEIGRDPWGRPFHFKVSGDGEPGDRVILRSAGADGVFQTSESSEVTSGDDILVELEVRG